MTDKQPLSELDNEELIYRYRNIWNYYQSEESRGKGYDFAKCREIKGNLDDVKAMLELRGYTVVGSSIEAP